MNFEKNSDPLKTLNIGRREYAIQIVSLLAKRLGLNDPDSSTFPNNPEIIFSWINSKDGSYIHLIEIKEEYSISYDMGLLNYGRYSIPEVVEVLKKDGIL